MAESFWIFVPRLCLCSPLSEYSCGLKVDFQVLSLQEAHKRGRSLCWGLELSPHFWTPLGLTSQGPFHHWEWATAVDVSLSWLGWEPGLCRVPWLHSRTTLLWGVSLTCHFPKAPSAPPGDHYFPSLKISWDGLRIQPVHLPFSALSQVERWNYSPLVLWPTIFKTKIWSYPALFVLRLLELFCFVLFYLNVCFFHFLSVKGGRPWYNLTQWFFSVSPQKSHTPLHKVAVQIWWSLNED